MRATAAAAVLARSSPGALEFRPAAIRRVPTSSRGFAICSTTRLADLAGVDGEEAARRGASVADATLEMHASASTSGARSVVDPSLTALKGMRFEELESSL